jgi:DNA-binding PadR family transcriptional regulator
VARLDNAHQPSQRLALTVLLLLREGPMHPYELKTTIERRHYHTALDLRLGSLYHVVSRLEADGLIAAGEPSREGRRPERTVYALTPVGRAEFDERLREFLTDVAHTPTRMTTAVQFLTSLEPDAARELLETRAAGLRDRVARIREGMAAPELERTMLLEWEHTLALADAELAWVEGVIADLVAGALTWAVPTTAAKELA